MVSKRNLDIARVDKARATKPSDSRPKAHQSIKHPAAKRLGYFKLLTQSWRAVFDSNIFQLSLLRNLLGIRAPLIALIPFVFFQLRYFLVLKPDQILAKAKNLVDPQNSSALITTSGLVLAAILVSFVADSIISPALQRYNFQKLAGRKVKMSGCLADAMSLSYSSAGQRLMKLVILVVTLSLVAGILYLAYIFGYGSLSGQISYFAMAMPIILIMASLYFSFKYWLQASFAIAGKDSRNRLMVAFDRILKHPLNSFGTGLIWVLKLMIFSLLAVGIAGLEIYLINSTGSIMAQLAVLALGTTLIYLIWSVWTAWQAGYWSSIVEYHATKERLLFEPVMDARYWQFISLVIIFALVVISYIIFCYMNADKIIVFLQGLSQRLPENLKITLPKP